MNWYYLSYGIYCTCISRLPTIKVVMSCDEPNPTLFFESLLTGRRVGVYDEPTDYPWLDILYEKRSSVVSRKSVIRINIHLYHQR